MVSKSEVCLFHISSVEQNDYNPHTDPRHPEHVDMKVGIEKTLHKRTEGVWKGHYGREYIRHILPNRMDRHERKCSMLIGGRKPEKVPFYRRVERLIHLELIDLVENKAYLLPDFPRRRPRPTCGPLRPHYSPCTCTKPNCMRLSGIPSSLFTDRCITPGPKQRKEVFSFLRTRNVGKIDQLLSDIINRWCDFGEMSFTSKSSWPKLLLLAYEEYCHTKRR
jgi:hypothetical protein